MSKSNSVLIITVGGDRINIKNVRQISKTDDGWLVIEDMDLEFYSFNLNHVVCTRKYKE